MDPRTTILDDWRSFRDADRLGSLLPRCTPRTWGDESEPYSIVTLDYRAYRDLSLEAGGLLDLAATADLVEVFWTVRLKGSTPDPNWATAVNVNVVRVSNEPVGGADLETTYRQAVVVRRALQQGGIGELIADCKPIALHVRGLVLGPSLSAPVAILEGLASKTDLPLAVGRYESAADGSIRFLSDASDAKVWDQGAPDPEALAGLGRRLLRHDALMKSQGIWPPQPEEKESKYGPRSLDF